VSRRYGKRTRVPAYCSEDASALRALTVPPTLSQTHRRITAFTSRALNFLRASRCSPPILSAHVALHAGPVLYVADRGLRCRLGRCDEPDDMRATSAVRAVCFDMTWSTTPAKSGRPSESRITKSHPTARSLVPALPSFPQTLVGNARPAKLRFATSHPYPRRAARRPPAGGGREPEFAPTRAVPTEFGNEDSGAALTTLSRHFAALPSAFSTTPAPA